MFVFALSVLMLGTLACLCGQLGNVIPLSGAAEEPTPTPMPPTEVPPTEEPQEVEEEVAPSPTVVTLETAVDVEQLNAFPGAEQVSLEMKVAPSGTELAVFGFDGVIRIFDVETGNEIESLSGHNSIGAALAYSPDGELLASGGDDFRFFMWDLETGTERYSFVADTNPADITFTPDGSKVVYVGFNNSRVFVIDVDGNEVGRIGEHGVVLGSVDVSPDGQFIASGNTRGNVVISKIDSLATVTTLNEGTGSLWATKFSPDGAWLAAGSGSGDIWLWDATNWALERDWLAHGGGVQYLAWSPDSSVLVSVGTNGKVTLWNPANGRELNSFQHTDGTIWKVDFAPDGSFFATLGGDDATVRIFGLP